MSQMLEIALVIESAEMLARAIEEIGGEIQRRKQLKTEEGKACKVDYVVVDAQGTEVGVRMDAKTKGAVLVPTAQTGKSAALAGRVAQRYAYVRTTEELRKKGYTIAKEEKQGDGSLRVVLSKWQ